MHCRPGHAIHVYRPASSSHVGVSQVSTACTCSCKCRSATPTTVMLVLMLLCLSSSLDFITRSLNGLVSVPASRLSDTSLCCLLLLPIAAWLHSYRCVDEGGCGAGSGEAHHITPAGEATRTAVAAPAHPLTATATHAFLQLSTSQHSSSASYTDLEAVCRMQQVVCSWAGCWDVA